MENETPRPLQAEEIRTGIAQMVADSVFEQLGKTCNLFGCAYPKFKGTVTIHLELDNFGQATVDNSITNVEGGEGEIGAGSVPVDAGFEIPEMPPNSFRMETDQPIIKKVVEDGKTVEKKVRYQPRQKKSVPKKTSKEKP